MHSALAGLVNRDGPRLYTLYNDGVDEQWLDYMTQRPFLRNATGTHTRHTLSLNLKILECNKHREER